MASPTQWTRVSANSRRCWWTAKPGMLQSMGSQRFGHDWTTEQQHLILTWALLIYDSNLMDCESGVNSLQFFKRSDVKVYILPRVVFFFFFFLLLIQVFLKALFRPNKLTLIIIPNYYGPDWPMWSICNVSRLWWEINKMEHRPL